MRKCANISPYVRRPLVKYDFATAPFWISWYMREIFFSFLSVWTASYIHTHTELHSQSKVHPKNLQLSSVCIHREPTTDFSRAVRGRLSFVLFSTTCKSMHTLWYGPPVQVQTSTNCLNWRWIFLTYFPMIPCRANFFSNRKKRQQGSDCTPYFSYFQS